MFDLSMRLKLEVLVQVKTEVKMRLDGLVEVATLTMDELNETEPQFECGCELKHWDPVFKPVAGECWQYLQTQVKLLINQAKQEVVRCDHSSATQAEFIGS